MKKIIYTCLAVLIIITGCTEVRTKPAAVKNYPESVYFQAEGTGQSEAEARNQAVAEMSRIFESKVFSDTYDRTAAIIDSGNETFRGNIESNIRVISSVELEGVRIAETWLDNEKGVYRALAILERQQAAKGWQEGIKQTDIKVESEFGALDSVSSKFMKLRSLMEIRDLWIEREVLVSRLRVIGFRDSTARSYDIKKAFNMVPQIKSGMLIYVQISGKHGKEIEDKLSESLNRAGFILSSSKSSADVHVTGTVTAKPVDLKNPDWEFSRANASLTVIDAVTGSAVGEVSDNARAGHLTYDEAVHKAVRKLTRTVPEEVLKYFE